MLTFAVLLHEESDISAEGETSLRDCVRRVLQVSSGSFWVSVQQDQILFRTWGPVGSFHVRVCCSILAESALVLWK